MKRRINHPLAWPIFAGIILAGLPLSALAQYPGSPSDNGTGVAPMAPLSASSMPRYGEGYNAAAGTPFAPVTTSRPSNWVGGTAPGAAPATNQPVQDSQPMQNLPPAQCPQTNVCPQTGAAPQTPLTWSSPINTQNSPSNYPSTGQQPIAPTINLPGAATVSPVGQIDRLNPNPTAKEMLNPSGLPQLNFSTEALARVGSEGIFASEITPTVDRYLAEVKAKLSPEEVELYREDFEKQRAMLTKQALKQHIESRLIFQDVRRDIPAEGMANVNKTLNNLFEKNELPKLMKRENAATVKELEQKLNVYGSSVAQEKTAFIEKSLIGEWVRRQVKPEEMPTVIQMTQYYEAHKADFTTPAKARWEELAVSKAKFATKEDALAAIAQMGNRVLVGGETFADVAKQSSDGFTAAKGGQRDWITKGSLKDKAIEDAVLGPTLPVGQLSQIIETPHEYTIVRVLERVDQKTEDFLAAQTKIGEKITEERNDRQLREYLRRLETRTPIWTIYDGDGGGLLLADRLKEDSSATKTAGRNGTRR